MAKKRPFDTYLVGIFSPIFFQRPRPWTRRPRRNSRCSQGSQRPILVLFLESFFFVSFFFRCFLLIVLVSGSSSYSSLLREFLSPRPPSSVTSSLLPLFSNSLRSLRDAARVVLPPVGDKSGYGSKVTRFSLSFVFNLASGLRN